LHAADFDVHAFARAPSMRASPEHAAAQSPAATSIIRSPSSSSAAAVALLEEAVDAELEGDGAGASFGRGVAPPAHPNAPATSNESKE